MKYLIASPIFFPSLAICLSIMGISACSISNSSDNRSSIDNLVVKNLTQTDVKNVEIRVEKLKGLFTCNMILADSFCSNGFRERTYENNQITISWSDKIQRHTIGPISINMPQALITINQKRHLPYTAVIELQNEGEFDAYFELPNSKY